MDPYMMYVGSFSRWKFGEEDAKGFLEATFHTKEKSWTYEFFENTYAPMYKTIGFGYKNTVFSLLLNITILNVDFDIWSLLKSFP